MLEKREYYKRKGAGMGGVGGKGVEGRKVVMGRKG